MKKIWSIAILSIILINFFNLLTPVLSSSKQEINIFYVDDDEKANWYDNTHYKSINSAIKNSSDNDKIIVKNGEYYENLIINKSIDLIGSDNSKIITNNSKNQSIITINSKFVNLSNFKIFYESKTENIGITIGNRNCRIDNITIENCYNGIFVDESDNTIYECNFYHNKNGIKISNTNNTNVDMCFFENNTQSGLDIYGSTNSTVKRSNFINNTWGISIRSIIYPSIPEGPEISPTFSNYNRIYLNNFINNTDHVHLGLYPKNNSFNNSKKGNYWDDYKGLDTDYDGIGETIYNISKSNYVDHYPLIKPYKIYEFKVNREEIFYILTIGFIVTVIFLIPIAYYFRKKILKL